MIWRAETGSPASSTFFNELGEATAAVNAALVY